MNVEVIVYMKSGLRIKDLHEQKVTWLLDNGTDGLLYFMTSDFKYWWVPRENIVGIKGLK